MGIVNSEQELRAAIRREAERALADLVSGQTLRALLETTGRYDERCWQHCREQSWPGIGIPERHGGVGLGLAEICILLESMGAAAVGVPFLESSFAAGQAILRHGSEALRAEWLPRLADGSVIGLLSIAEVNAALPRRPALRWESGLLHGSKPAVPAAACADIAVLLVASAYGVALVLTDLRQSAVARTPLSTFDNSRGAADLKFHEATAVLLQPGDACAAAHELLDLQAVLAAHLQLGGAAKVLAMARDHAVQRRAFGQPIGAFQSIKHRLAEDYVLVELARASAAEAVAVLESADFSRAAMAARLLATEAYETTARDAVQIHGGIGVTWESDLHLHQRRARALALELGSTLAWEDRLAGTLAGELT
jgi:acyl-CoA dehydrogenase